MDAVDAVRVAFLLAAATTFSVSIPTSLRSRFLAYGPRATPSRVTPTSPGLLDYLATWKVPHNYFTHFYIASVLSSVFWSVQLIFHGSAFEAIAAHVSSEHQQQSMSLTQVLICEILLAMQGARRLWESFLFSKPSSSQMWMGHWLVGLGFYLLAGIAVWIEGTGSILSQSLTIDDLKMTNAPSLRTFLCVPIFLVASGLQHDCHHYLFSLEKYTLPDHPLFRRAVCPHYGAECIIYLCLALIGAPSGHVANKTLLTCLAFVAVNLGLTAQRTKQWYKQKFGKNADMMNSRWLMIPGIY